MIAHLRTNFIHTSPIEQITDYKPGTNQNDRLSYDRLHANFLHLYDSSHGYPYRLDHPAYNCA